MLIRNGIERFNNKYSDFFESAATLGLAALVGAGLWAANQTGTGERAIDNVESKLDKATVVVVNKTNDILGRIVGVEPIGPSYPENGIIDQPSFDPSQYQRFDPDQAIA